MGLFFLGLQVLMGFFFFFFLSEEDGGRIRMKERGEWKQNKGESPGIFFCLPWMNGDGWNL